MGIFGNFFKKTAFHRFESAFKKIRQKQISERNKDQRDAFLTPDILADRKKYTKNGRQSLVLQFGEMGGKVELFLDKPSKFGKKELPSLNDMAAAVARVETDVKEKHIQGVPVKHLLSASASSDIHRAKTEIRNSILYKINGNLLHFRVSASEKSQYTHHQVRIRLEEWEHSKKRVHGETYIVATRKASWGRMSFDCDCGRHRYWYRYLTHLGGFGLDPAENIFPKIRNPGLTGCCCKHVLKSIATLLSPVVQSRLSKEMEEQAKEKGFLAKHFGKSEKFIVDDEMENAGELSSVDDVQSEIKKEFETYRKAKKGFKKKVAEQKKKQPKPTRTEVKAVKKVTELEKNLFIERLKNALLMAQVNNVPIKKAVADFAKQWHSTPEEIETIAKKYNV